MEFLFDLLLTAFFSLLFAFLLSKLFSPSATSSAPSSSVTASASRDAADVISGEASSTSKEDLANEGRELQEEKIIEVDKVVVEKEAERGFLAEEVRSQFSESIGIGGGKVAVCEGTEEIRTDGFGSHVEVEKEKLDHGLVQTDESFELQPSINSDKESELCAGEVGDGKVAQNFDLTLLQDQNFVRHEEESLREIELSDSGVQKDDTDNICKVEGLTDKMFEEVEVSSEKDSFLKEEHELKVDSPGSVILQEKIVSHGALVSREIENEKDEEYNLCAVEGPISKTATEDNSHLGELIVPEEISALVIESKNETELIESSELKKEEVQEEEGNLFKAEGPTSRIAQLVEVVEEEKEKAFIEEEDWEGIERTDTEKQFAVAAGYASSVCGTDALAKLSNEVQLQLYSLHKVATEGPCYESNPMALRTSTRAKWHAWQKLGNMNPETAMEEYLNVLSKNVPNWSEQPIVDTAHNESNQLTVESGSCIEGPAAFGSASPEKGTEAPASIQ